MCQPGGAQVHLAPSCSCGCWGCGPSFRRFFSSKEEKECLEAYKEELKKELAGVENRIREIKGK